MIAPKQCVVLVGGLGTRLGALTAERPKPLLPVAGRPFLHYLLWHARRFGFERVLLLAGYKSEVLAEELAGLALEGLSLEVEVEPEPLGTGGALCAAKDRLDDGFLLLNGDSLFDFNWLSLIDLARDDAGCEVAMSLRSVPDASRFGVAELRDGKVAAFHERGGPEGGLINAGVYLVRRTALDGFTGKCSFERDILPALGARGCIRGATKEGFFLDIGVPESYAAAQDEVPASLRRGALFLDWGGPVTDGDGPPLGQPWLDCVRLANDRNLLVFALADAPIQHGMPPEAAPRQPAIQRGLRAFGAHIDDVRHWPRHSDGSASDVIQDLAGRWPVELAVSLLVSDHTAAAAAGITVCRLAGSDPGVLALTLDARRAR